MDRMANKEGMNLIKVNKSELLAKLKVNRDEHKDTFREAWIGYREDVIKELKQHLKAVKAGADIESLISFDTPESHINDYETIIEMLTMSVDDEVYLTRSEFKQYIRDEWSWKNTFVMNSAKYI